SSRCAPSSAACRCWWSGSPAQAGDFLPPDAGCRPADLRAADCWRSPKPSGSRGSLPFEGSLLPHVNEAEQQQAGEDPHLHEPDHAQVAEHGGPREDEDDFQVEDDELDGDEVVAHVELHARVIERLESGLVGRQLRLARPLGPQGPADQQQGHADADGDDQEQQGGQVFSQHVLLSWLAAASRPAAALLRRAPFSYREGEKNGPGTAGPMRQLYPIMNW